MPPGRPGNANDHLLIAHLTDLHLTPAGSLYNDTRDGWVMLDNALDAILRVDPLPSYVVVSGDIADAPSNMVYERFRERIGMFPLPIYAFPGNHDDRQMFKVAFRDHGYFNEEDDFAHFVIESEPLRVIVLDSLDPPTGEARLCAERINWLEQRLLEEPERPTMLFMHHQPLYTRLGFQGEAHAFPGVDLLIGVLQRHRHIQCIACGHLHRPIYMQLAGVPVCVAPSTTYQRTLTVHNSAAKAFVDEPVSMLLHLWHHKTGLVTHTHFVDHFGPHDPMIDAL